MLTLYLYISRHELIWMFMFWEVFGIVIYKTTNAIVYENFSIKIFFIIVVSFIYHSKINVFN
jgi:hypothetical protein